MTLFRPILLRRAIAAALLLFAGLFTVVVGAVTPYRDGHQPDPGRITGVVKHGCSNLFAADLSTPFFTLEPFVGWSSEVEGMARFDKPCH